MHSQALGGRFSSTLPSDILKPGAFANQSVPARARIAGREFAPLYGNSSELRKISTLMAQCAAKALAPEVELAPQTYDELYKRNAMVGHSCGTHLNVKLMAAML